MLPVPRTAQLGHADRFIVGELMERVTGTSPDQFHGAILDWLVTTIGGDSALFMPAPDRKIRPVERNKGAFVQRYLDGAQRYLTCLRKTIAALKRDGLFIDVDVYSNDERENLPLYAEILRPQGISSQLVVGIWFQRRHRGTLHLCRHGMVSPFRSSAMRRVSAAISAIGLIDAAAAAATAPTPTPTPTPTPAPTPTPTPTLRGDIGLSTRERNVAELAGRGLQTKEIAALLGTRPATVRNQLHAIFRKLDVSNRAELAFVLAGTLQ